MDFSSGQAEKVEDTAVKVEVVSEKKVQSASEKAFSKFRELSETIIAEELKAAGSPNVTIFAVKNTVFDELTTAIDNVDPETAKRWMLKHFLKGYLKRRDMEFGNSTVSIFRSNINSTKIKS